MNTEILQNNEVLTRILIMAVPVAVAFLISIICLAVAKIKCGMAGLDSKELMASMLLYLIMCATNFMYALVEVLLILTERIAVTKLVQENIVIFIIVGVLSMISCLAKGIIGGKFMPLSAGANKQQGLSKAMVFMAVAEIPGLISLAIFLVKFLV